MEHGGTVSDRRTTALINGVRTCWVKRLRNRPLRNQSSTAGVAPRLVPTQLLLSLPHLARQGVHNCLGHGRHAVRVGDVIDHQLQTRQVTLQGSSA